MGRVCRAGLSARGAGQNAGMADKQEITVVPHAPVEADSRREERDTLDGPRLIELQHTRIRSLLDEVSASVGQQRQAAFDELRELLARHETAEEMVLRPLSRSVEPDVAEARMDEENEAKEQLARLEAMDVTGEEFARAFAPFADAVRAHAKAEEEDELPAVVQRLHDDPRLRERVADALRAAERSAPTHPHPGVRSTAANYAVGPFAAMVDRARDAIGKVTG